MGFFGFLNKSVSMRFRRGSSARALSGEHGHGIGIGEVKVSRGGEGNGCDRCGFPSEEHCCPGFWNDAGIPPCWPLSWIFDPANKYLNDNHFLRMFGNIGFQFFDKERKAFMGTALAITVFAIIITMFGAFALASDTHIVRLTAWGIAYSQGEYNEVNNTRSGQVAYLGLRKFVVYRCGEGAVAGNPYSWTGCEASAEWWMDATCEGGAEDYYGFPCDRVAQCRDTSESSIAGTFLTCITLLFALLGCLTRIRKVADTNFQKVIGCIPDSFGIIMQTLALVQFRQGCYARMPAENSAGERIHYVIGAGYWAYVFCLLSALVRAGMHYCTPVPGGGAGCQCVDVHRSMAVLTAQEREAQRQRQGAGGSRGRGDKGTGGGARSRGPSKAGTGGRASPTAEGPALFAADPEAGVAGDAGDPSLAVAGQQPPDSSASSGRRRSGSGGGRRPLAEQVARSSSWNRQPDGGGGGGEVRMSAFRSAHGGDAEEDEKGGLELSAVPALAPNAPS